MLIPRFILAPLVGGVIGYITNDLAIRMLFRPRKAVYIGKFHVPFTPGLIPSQQGRIAQSIGGVISQQLLNEETLRQTLLSHGAISLIRRKATAALRMLSKDERRISDLLTEPGILDRVNMSVDELEQKLTDGLRDTIIDAKLGYAVVDSTIGNWREFIAQNKIISMVLDQKAQEGIRQKLAEMINDLIAQKAPEASAIIVHRFREYVMETRLCDLYAQFQDKEEVLVQSLIDLYTSIMEDNLGKILRAINIERIVVDKINAFDPAQLESMIFGIMKHELRAIVYLGALLGAVMGFINLLL